MKSSIIKTKKNRSRKITVFFQSKNYRLILLNFISESPIFKLFLQDTVQISKNDSKSKHNTPRQQLQ